MRVLHFALAYKSAPALGGPNYSVYRLCTELHRRGVEVDVIATNLISKEAIAGPYSTETHIEGVNVRYLVTKKLISMTKHSFGVYYIPELWSLLRRDISRYDILHFHGYRDYMTLVGAIQAMHFKVPYIIQPRGTMVTAGYNEVPKSAFDLVIGNRMLRRASRLVALSEREARHFTQKGVAPDQVSIVYNGLDTDDYQCPVDSRQFRDAHGITEKYIIMYLGRIHQIKGVDHMVRAVAALRGEGLDVCAVVVGPDEGFASVLQEIASEENFSHLYMLDAVTGHEKTAALSAASVFVYASKVEEFGLSAFEAILCGTPVIVSQDTGCGGIFADLGVGRQVPYGNLEQMSSVIKNILETEPKERQRIMQAKERIATTLSWPAIAAKMQQNYADIVHGR